MHTARIALVVAIAFLALFAAYCHTAEPAKPYTAALVTALALILCAIEMLLSLV